jgi:hypothetical protein
VHTVFSLSKMPASRQFLVEADADRILLKLTQIENPKLQTNCSRSRKNLSSDAAETIEVGAVQQLIAMSLEGKSSSKNTEDIEEPDIRNHDDASFGPLRPYENDEIESGIDTSPWQMTVPIFKGESAGRGPSAPEPPNMTTESSVDHPSTIEDLDAGGESDVARTKMAFAKMQTPFELRDSYGFDDKDFEVREEEPGNDEDGISEYDDDGDLTSSISGEGSHHILDKESIGKESSVGMEDDDSFNAASVYDQEEVEEKPKPVKKKKKQTAGATSKAKQVSSDAVGDVVAELGLY